MSAKPLSWMEMRVAAVVIDPQTQAPMVILRAVDAPERYLPIVVGGLEAAAIATALTDTEFERPLTHDLFHGVLVQTGWQLVRARVHKLHEDTFYADIILREPVSEREITRDARPSDAIALAMRAGAILEVADTVLDKAGAVVDEGAVESGEAGAGEEAITGSNAVLDREVRLEDLDLDLFGKYKM